MKTASLLLLLALPHFALAEPDEMSGGEAFLAASLAALSTPAMKQSPVQVHGAITQASGVQEDYGATAIVAIPDSAAAKLDLAHLPADGSPLPLCRLWVKGFTLSHEGKALGAANAQPLEVKARGEKHSVMLWLLGVRRSARGTPEVILCANQKQPVLVLPAEPLKTPAAADVPVKVSVSHGELRLGLLGTHGVRVEIGRVK